jgi:HSP20 family molecular chaperone IbpA
MSGVKDVEKSGLRQMQTTQARHKHELERLERAHEKIKADVIKNNEAELTTLQMDHNRRLESEVDRKEKVLGQLQEHLQKTRSMTEKEVKTLKEEVGRVRKQDYDNFVMNRDRIQSENELQLQELVQRHNSQIKQVHQEGQRNINDLIIDGTREYSQQREHLQGRLGQQNTEFNSAIRQNDQHHQKYKEQQQKHFSHEKKITALKNETELSEVSQRHQQSLDLRKVKFKEAQKRQEGIFENKWSETLQRHNQSYTQLDQGHEKAVNQLKRKLAGQIHEAEVRSHEPFYQFNEIEPVLKQYADGVEIQVAVPDYAKEDLKFMINGREAIVNFHRRYQDARKEDNGTLNRVNKVESYTSRIPTEKLLDPKTVQTSYENGIMTYSVKNA